MAEQSTEQAKSSYTVLICIDNSDNAHHAFEHYANHAHRPDHEVLLVHVTELVRMPTYALFSGATYMGPWISDGEGVGYSPDEIHTRLETIRGHNKALKEKYEKECKERQIKHKTIIISDDIDGVSVGAGAAVVDAAKKHHVNLIVVGSRGLGAIRRTFLGSTSDYIIHHCHIPTLVVPVPKK